MPTDTPRSSAAGLPAAGEPQCEAWCLSPGSSASVRCILRADHGDGMHLSDGPNGERFRWEPVNFDPFAHTGGNHANV